MKSLLAVLKGTALLAAISLLAVSAVSQSAAAHDPLDQDPIVCANTGDDCAVIEPNDDGGESLSWYDRL